MQIDDNYPTKETAGSVPMEALPNSWRMALLDTPEEHLAFLCEKLKKTYDPNDRLFTASLMWGTLHSDIVASEAYSWQGLRRPEWSGVGGYFPGGWQSNQPNKRPTRLHPVLIAAPLSASEKEEAKERVRHLILAEASGSYRRAIRTTISRVMHLAEGRCTFIRQNGLTALALMDVEEYCRQEEEEARAQAPDTFDDPRRPVLL